MQLDHFHFDELDKLIATVQACGGEHVTVAGGAVRDSVLEKPIKDIDVFYEGELNEEAVQSFFGKKKEGGEKPPEPKRPGLNVSDAEFDAWVAAFDEWVDTYGETDFEVSSYGGSSFSFEGKTIQLVKVDDVDKTIAEFPCIISRMFYSEGMLVIPKEVIRDVCLGILSFTDDCNDSYKTRISTKYSDYA
jgi:hypothetical protein